MGNVEESKKMGRGEEDGKLFRFHKRGWVFLGHFITIMKC